MKSNHFTLLLLLLLVGTLQAKPIADRPKSRVGLAFQGGVGFENTDMVNLQNGGKATISFGGGNGINLNLGREFSPQFDLSASIGMQTTKLSPILNNADVTFESYRISLTPAYIIQIKDGSRMRVKVGAGIDLSWGNELTIETNKLTDGYNDTWKYDSAIGYHINAKYEINVSRHWSFSGGLQYDGIQYKFLSSSNHYPLHSDLKSPNGGAVNIILGANFCF